VYVFLGGQRSGNTVGPVTMVAELRNAHVNQMTYCQLLLCYLKSNSSTEGQRSCRSFLVYACTESISWR